MMRRSLLALLGLPLVGDGLVRPQNAPVAQQPSVGVQPGTTSAIVRANTVIVFGPTGAPVGIFVYQPGTTPGSGNPPIAWLTASTIDPYANTLPSPDIGTRSGNAFSALDAGAVLLGNTAFTGQAILSAGFGGGGTAALSIESPDTSGTDTRATVNMISKAAGTEPMLVVGGDLEVFSQTVVSGTASKLAQVATGETDLTSSMATVSDVAAVMRMLSKLAAGTVPQFVFNGSLTSTAGTAAQPTDIETDTSGGNIASNANSWTGTLKYKLLPFNAVQVNGILVPPAGVANPSNVNVALAAAYQPNSTQQLSAVEDPGVPHLGQSLICEMQVSGVIRVYDSTAGEAVRIFGTYALDF